jgi:hypothetical protein
MDDPLPVKLTTSRMAMPLLSSLGVSCPSDEGIRHESKNFRDLEKIEMDRVMNQGPNSQNFLRQILKIFVTLGLNILRFLYTKSIFSKQISLKIDIVYYKSNKIPIFMFISSKIYVKVTKILRICRKKLCEYPPRGKIYKTFYVIFLKFFLTLKWI